MIGDKWMTVNLPAMTADQFGDVFKDSGMDEPCFRLGMTKRGLWLFPLPKNAGEDMRQMEQAGLVWLKTIEISDVVLFRDQKTGKASYGVKYRHVSWVVKP